MRKRYWLSLAGLGVAVVLGFGLATSQAKRGSDVRDEGDTPAPVDGRQKDGSARAVAASIVGVARPYRGPADAPVTIVEFTDYQCPFCARHFQQTYPLLLQNYGDRIKYIVRNFPIVQSHRHAMEAAEAAECAFDQGKFWEYHDRLFEGNSALDHENLKRYAEDVGLDTLRFSECLDSGRKSPIVARDLEDGSRNGVRGTPTFFINGRILIGAQHYAVFRDYIERALQEARAE